MNQIIETEDNSHTIFDQKTGEHYHSIHGAIQESTHIFIEAGLKCTKPATQTLNILEIGMGTGLNVLLTLMHSENISKRINYISIELYPIEKEIINQLNYPKLLHKPDLEIGFQNIHNEKWNIPYYLTENIILNKINADFNDLQLTENSFDLVYFDAFSPETQPDLWTDDVFEKLYKSMKNNGLFVTYCAKGIVKRSLKKAGFQIEILAGPKGKRHIIRATKKIEISNCCNHKHE